MIAFLDTTILTIKLGDDDVVAMYLGDTQVFDVENIYIVDELDNQITDELANNITG